MSSRHCHYCGAGTDLRPYGPYGSWVCYPCVTSTPERDAAAGAVLMALIEASAAMSPADAVVLDEDGPRPLTPGEEV